MFGEQLLSSFVTGAFNTLGTGLNARQNYNLANIQNSYNLDMWRLQNEYNSPAAQRARLEAAGYNPNLFYSMGSTGNAAQAPQKNAPAPVDLQRLGSDLGKIFNLENLKTIHANRKEAEASAQIKTIEAADAKDRRAAMRDFQHFYEFNPSSGRYEPISDLENVVNVERKASGAEKRLTKYTGSPTNRVFFFNQALADDYTRRALIPYRQKLMGSQTDYLQPQIWMANYEKKNYPYSYWIGQGSKVVGSLGNILPKWKFSRNSGSPLSTITNTTYRYSPHTSNIKNIYSPF